MEVKKTTNQTTQTIGDKSTSTPTTKTGKIPFFEWFVTWWNAPGAKPGFIEAFKAWWHSSETAKPTTTAPTISSRRVEKQNKPKVDPFQRFTKTESQNRKEFYAIVNDLLTQELKGKMPFNDIITEYGVNFSRNQFPTHFELIKQLIQTVIDNPKGALSKEEITLLQAKFKALDLSSDKYSLSFFQKKELDIMRNSLTPPE